MNRLPRFLLTAVIVVLGTFASSTLTQARPEYMYSSGTCANGNTWYCVTEFVDGMAVSCRGVDCRGYHYFRNCSVAVVPTNPFAGSTPNLSGTCDGPLLSWIGLIAFSAEGYPSQICGKNCAGQYWTATLAGTDRPEPKKSSSNPAGVKISPVPGRHID